jgi:hypothetical protein
MSAKLLDFFALGVNSQGVSYLLIPNEENGVNKIFKCDMHLDSKDDSDYKITGIFFGAQYSLNTRRVNNCKLIERKT